ncbi:MAG: DUF1501 domain-containing protein [bacterium]|nr:DUF1501 domain-containing protein [bacterium]
MTHDHSNHGDHIDHGEHSCQEYAELSRRQFLGRTSTIAAATATSPAWLPQVALGRTPGGGSGRDTFISIFLRGGQDGLTVVAPYADPNYAPQRPTLAVPPPGAPGGAIDLDGFFGLAPAAAPLMTPYSAGHLLIAHAAGSPDANLSHFTSQFRMEVATPNQTTSTIDTGWLARHLQVTPPVMPGTLRGIALSSLLPATLSGAPGSIPIPDPATFAFPGDPSTAADRRAIISNVYANADEPLGSAAESSLTTIDLLDSINFEGYVPANGAVYPETPFGQGLRSIAAMIKADIDLEAAHLDFEGWDHHADQGPVNGIMALLLDEFSRSLEAFYLDMSGDLDRFTLCAMTEFGRRIAENGSFGTDHGHGGVIWVMGGHVDGGRVYRNWPGLVGGNGSLEVTTDYRHILAEILTERMQNTDLVTVFPNFTPTPIDIIV